MRRNTYFIFKKPNGCNFAVNVNKVRRYKSNRNCKYEDHPKVIKRYHKKAKPGANYLRSASKKQTKSDASSFDLVDGKIVHDKESQQEYKSAKRQCNFRTVIYNGYLGSNGTETNHAKCIGHNGKCIKD